MSDNITKITPHETILFRERKLPRDYHCKCNFCTENFLGEIYHTEENKYYSQAARYCYYPKELRNKHLCPGHWQGYRFAIQQFTKVGDWVFDPTVGTGTAVVESINNGRNGIGIELEYPEVAKANVKAQKKTAYARGKIISGNAENLTKLLKKNKIEYGTFSLVINGTPYYSGSGISSDAPERRSKLKYKNGVRLMTREEEIASDKTFDYQHPDNFGKKTLKEYWNFITKMYLDCLPFLEKRGKLVIIIKDTILNKKAYLLHKEIIEHILSGTTQLKYYGSFIHKHIPTTLFMNTYNKRYPKVKLPLYQTGIVLEKK